MPLTLPPITRRRFVKSTFALGAATLAPTRTPATTDEDLVEMDRNRVALLADTHISADRNFVYPGTKWPGSPVKESEHESVHVASCLEQVARNVIALNPRPERLIVNGDCAFGRGSEAEYQEFLRLVEPIRAAKMTIHVTIGNHDHRENLWKLLPFLKQETLGIQAEVVELPYANLLLLDSGNGSLGEEQLDWLAGQLDQRPEKPALVFSHYNPFPNRGVRPIPGMRDGAALLKVLANRTHAKAYFYGHTHEWRYDQQDHLRLVNQPAVSYYFGKGHAHGWVDMCMTKNSARLELQCLNQNHRQDGDTIQIALSDTGE